MLSANTEHFALMFTASLCIKHNEHQKCVRDVAIMGLCVGQGVTSVPGEWGAGCCCQFVGLGHCTWGVSNLAITVYQGLCEIINLAPLLRRNSIGVQDLRWWPWLRWHLKLAPSLIVNILWVLICIASLFVWCVRYTLLQEALVWWMAPVCARYVHPATVPCATRKHLSRNGHTFGSYFVALLVQLVKICLHLVV